jgi:ATP-dependent DNA ligase
MTDQLSLRLEAELPRPPAALRPMRARPLAEPFDSPEHLFEPAWGGRRVLAFIGPAERPGTGEVSLVDEDGAAIVPVPPDLAGLASRVDARSAVLDGELVVVDAHGRLDGPELERRLRGERGRPLAFLAFDLLHVDGRSLLTKPLNQRRQALRRILHPADEVVAVPAIPGEGRALYEAVAAQGLAGIRARQAASPYLPGVRSRLWRFVEVTRAGRSPRAASAPEDSPQTDATLVPEASPEAHGGTVLAVFRRLPLDLEETQDLEPPRDA